MASPAPQSSARHRKRPIVPDDQRKRVRKACVPCRTNKLKCDGLSPCQRCQSAQSTCRFAERRSVDPQSRPTERESILEAILRARNIHVPTDLDELRCYSERLQLEAPDADTSKNRDNIVIDNVPAPQTYVHDETKTYFDGGSSAWAFFDSVRETFSNSPGTAKDRQTAYRHFIIDPPNLLSGHLRASLMATLPPRPVLDFLATTFFRYSQSNAFFLHPAIFSRKTDAFLSGTAEFDPQGNNTTRRPLEFICILFTILAIGSQLRHARHLGHLGAPAKAQPWRFYRLSRRLLSDVVSTCSMTSIQACALQGTFLLSTSAHDIAYNVFGLAVRMAVGMGMHRAVGAGDLHPQVRELRSRLWWSVYTHERLLTFQLGRPLMLDDEEIDAPFPEDLPELRVPQYTGSVQGQIALIKLYRIMGRIVKFLYARRTPSSGGQVIDIKTFGLLKSSLHEWRSQLPEALQLSPTSTRGVIHLHLTYEHAVMLLSRIPLSHAAASKDDEQSQADQHNIKIKIKFLQDATRDCVSAALMTIKLLKRLKERRLLCQYSCQDPLYCSSALHVLLLGAKLEPPTESTKLTIAEGIFILRELANGSEAAASSLGGILSGFKPSFQSASDSTPDDASPTDVARVQGHQAWQQWVSVSDETDERPPEPSNGRALQSTDIMDNPRVVYPGVGDPSPAYAWAANDATASETPAPVAQAAQSADAEGQVVSPDYDQFGPQGFLNSWMVGGQPFWLSDLNNSFDVLEHDLTQTPMGDELNIWEMMPTVVGRN